MRRGELSFWYDNWNSDLNYSKFVDGHDGDILSDFWHDDHWNFDELLPILGEELTQYTLERTPIITNNKGIILWKFTEEGEFTMKSAWQ